MLIQKISSAGEIRLKKNSLRDGNIISTVASIISDVTKNGDKALKKLTAKFDKAVLKNIEVDEKELCDAVTSIAAKHKSLFRRIISNIEKYQANTIIKSWEKNFGDGAELGEIITPVESAGLYIPGGTAPLISSVFMSAVPAYMAGVKNIYICTPPDKNGKINPYILVAAKMCKVKKIFKIGGAQAIAAMAYGTQTVPKVDKIIGPGNIFVTLAKKAVYGEVDIDMIAGPSEILVYADESSVPEYVAADLISQAEHDTLASSYLVTTSEKLAEEVSGIIRKNIKELPRHKIIDESIKNNMRIFIVKNSVVAIDVINKIAPEHLELCIKSPKTQLRKIKNAGAIFIGNFTPEPVGDYYAGPSHILPTAGTAKYYSPVSINTFFKRTSVINYSEEKLKNSALDIIEIAELEQLRAHANAIRVRIKS